MKHNQHNSTNLPIVLTALAYLAFVIYGSLVPLTFRSIPLNEALSSFQNIRYLNLGIGSLADWVANILLFIPLTFIWLGLFWPDKNDLTNNSRFLKERTSTARMIVVSLMILFVAIFLSFIIEFTQLFFPPRTVSQNDIIAESMGAAIGIIAWWWIGPQLLTWLKQLKHTHGTTHVAERLLWIYLAILFGYNILPLDLTISPIEIYHKWNEGRIVLIPFSFVVEDTAQLIYNLLSDIIIWVPVSFLWILSSKKNYLQAWRWAVLAAITLEILQLLVYSRVTDITDIFTAMMGAAIGVWLVRYWNPENTKTEIGNKYKWFWIGLSCFMIWSLILIIIFWYPFDFKIERHFITERLSLFLKVPFHTYYYGTEFRAITEAIHKIAFFIPTGITLAIASFVIKSKDAHRLFTLASLICITCMATVIELGQIALPEKFPDNTDLILEIFGGAFGYFGSQFLASRLKQDTKKQGTKE